MGTMTITTTAQQDARIVVAFGHYLGLAGNANAAQVKQEVFNFIRGVVAVDEKRVAEAAAIAAADAGLTDLGQST